MNKKFLLFFLSLFFVLPFSTHALSYTVNNQEYTVDSIEKVRDYCYFTYYKNGNPNNNTPYDSFFVFKYDDLYPKCIMFNSQNGSKTAAIGFDSVYFDSGANPDYYHISEDYSEVTIEYNVYNSFSGYVHSILYSNVNIKSVDASTQSFNANFTVEDIENSYQQTSEPDPSEPEIPSDDTEKDIPEINKNEFYCLLFLLSLLIWLLYFKWCFPMKGGKKV